MNSWLLTSTFYGNWLPGDRRGFVGRVLEQRVEDDAATVRHVHHERDTPYDRDMPGLQAAAAYQMKGEPVLVNVEQAATLVNQFQETASHRGWRLVAAAVMANHIHLVVQFEGYVDVHKILGDFKAYGSRVLNQGWGKPPNGTWWTSQGSKRPLPDEAALRNAVQYAMNQHGALSVWCDPEFATSSGVA